MPLEYPLSIAVRESGGAKSIVTLSMWCGSIVRLAYSALSPSLAASRRVTRCSVRTNGCLECSVAQVLTIEGWRTRVAQSLIDTRPEKAEFIEVYACAAVCRRQRVSRRRCAAPAVPLEQC